MSNIMITKHESRMRDSVSSNSKHRKHRRRELTRGVVFFDEIRRVWKCDETMSLVFDTTRTISLFSFSTFVLQLPCVWLEVARVLQCLLPLYPTGGVSGPGFHHHRQKRTQPFTTIDKRGLCYMAVLSYNNPTRRFGRDLNLVFGKKTINAFCSAAHSEVYFFAEK